MNLRHPKPTEQAMTLFEVGVVIVIIGFFALFLAPAFIAPKHVNHSKIHCFNNLKQIGLAVYVWAGDHNDLYPMETSVTNGGTLEYMDTADAWKVFQVMSNELSTPITLFCRSDATHAGCATDWSDDLTNHLSYFIGIDATSTKLNRPLSGDDNFLLNGSPISRGRVDVSATTSVSWDDLRHGSRSELGWFNRNRISGNILLPDASVQSLYSPDLNTQFHRTSLATNRLFIP